MKCLATTLIIALFFMSPNLVSGQTGDKDQKTIERANSPLGNSLELCEQKQVGNLGFYNPYEDSTFYVILIDNSYGSEIVSHFKIPPKQTKWQPALKTYKNDYEYYLFSEMPELGVSKIKNSKDFIFKSRVYVVQCQNEVITIAY